MKNDRVAQLYGYTVCLISIVTLLFSAPQFVSSFFSDPDSDAPYFNRPSISSFESYKATREREPGPDASKQNVKSEAQLHAEYDAVRRDRLESYKLQKRQSMISSGLLIGFAIVLFLTHWQFLKRRDAAAGGSAEPA